MAYKRGFIKYECEDIRTEYYNKLTTAASADIPSGTVVKVASGAVAASGATSDLTAANINNTVFLLAEDVKKGDKGFVYYIVENIANLEERV